jgi:hypothetical protein
MFFIEECWCSKTKRYKRGWVKSDFGIEGGRRTMLTIESGGEKKDIVLIGMPDEAKTEDIARIVAEYALNDSSEDEALLVGTAKEMKRFLPRDPRVSSRYQPIIGVPGVSWGILIRRKEESILKMAAEESHKATGFMNELTALVWNIERELSPGGKLLIARKMYEGTWRDPWERPYRCGLQCGTCPMRHQGKFF